MATFIPEWSRASGRDLQIRRILAALDDAHVVRRPLRPGTSAADLFVQHRRKGWLALAASSLPFADLDPAQLFASAQRQPFEQRLSQLRHLGSTPGPAFHGMAAVAVMWACSTDEVRMLTREYLGRYGVRLVSREQFVQLGPKLVHGMLTPLPPDIERHLLGSYFPEAEIPAALTTRRYVDRHSSAQPARFFLDDEQEAAAKLDLDLDLDLPPEQHGIANDFSVRLVNGVAGSGKTLIAINRALLLAELFPRQRILVLIHNTPIVADLKFRLRRSLGSHGSLPPNLELLTFFAWAREQWHGAFKAYPQMLDDPQEVLRLVQQRRSRWPALKLSNAQVVDEIDFINDALIADGAAYLAASRSGRGFALRPAERSRMWALYEAVSCSLRADGRQIWSDLPRTIALTPSCHPALRRYDHILIDEAQFFTTSWFELVKLSLAPRGQLFLCADPNQGFLKNRLSWKSAGLDVAGRTKKLLRSYRTTQAILQAATAVLALLGGGDTEEGLEPDFAGMDAGTRPRLVYARRAEDAIDRLAQALEARAAKISLSALLVIYGDRANKAALHRSLQRVCGAGKVWWFNERTQKKGPPGGPDKDYLRLASLQTATGLEAHTVFLIGLDNLFFPVAPSRDSGEENARREDNARKVYMAMTRAGRRLVLISRARLPAEIEALFDLADPAESPAAFSR
jgi:UvrD-like helicase C-terminal domain